MSFKKETEVCVCLHNIISGCVDDNDNLSFAEPNYCPYLMMQHILIFNLSSTSTVTVQDTYVLGLFVNVLYGVDED